MIYDKVCQMLSYQLGIDEDKISASSDIFEDLGADSLDVVTLLMSLEDEFGLTIDDDQAQDFHTVGDVVSFIENNT
ncbi:MAG: acyl carrier protein [Clostridiaceae bacterium]|nr:acyl carrier protein [Clostridiales bacterium]MDD6877858.1 acyl carrier protein [Clostridiaceae bacterium]MDY3070760.1 acyl carrier protein [Eubacteriales bacterium]MDY3287176.1 acyl carrier protein [Eubacteriales bacterium]MDY5016886.1 acyl carrier protein [Eubacteriales bacterium]